MASRKDNLKSLFSNTRTRVIILFTTVLLLLAVVIGYVKLKSIGEGAVSSADVVSAPGIQSIPGALDPTAQYAKLQEEQNLSQAKQAETTGGSAIPTIIRTQALGQGVGVVGSKGGESGIGFSTLARQDEAGAQRSLWIEALKNGHCSKSAIDQVMAQGAQLTDIKSTCSCPQLKSLGYSLQDLEPVCACKELKAAGYTALQLKNIGFTAGRLRACGFDACQLKSAGFTAQEMKDGGYSDGELKGAGFSDEAIDKTRGLPDGITAADIRNAGCGVAALTKLRQAGVTALAIRQISGCTAAQLKAAGYSAKELKDAGFTAAELKNAGFTPEELKAAGFTAGNLLNAGFTPDDLLKAGFTPDQIKAGQTELIATKDKATDCSVDSLKKARAAGVTASTIRETLGCSAQAMKDAGYTAKELKDAGYTAAELKNAGFSAKALKDAGFTAKELRDAGFTGQQLKDAGFSAKELKDAGFTAAQLKNLGFTAAQLKAAGFSAKELKDAGFTANELRQAGFDANQLKDAGFPSEESQVAGLENPVLQAQTSVLGGIPKLPLSAQAAENASSSQQLQAILDRQNQQMAEQKYQQKIQQRTSDMLSAANQSLQDWKRVSTQVYTEGNDTDKTETQTSGLVSVNGTNALQPQALAATNQQKAIIKTGDIVFAVMDTSVNSDEPGPILATIVSGKLKGTKLIGSFNLPSNASKMVITFNTLSVPGASKTISIAAYAIDPNTARTALSSRTNHHYMMRYGSLFASSFIEGFGNAFQSANTTVTVGGTGGGNNITVQNGIGRSTLENAVIGLATVGKSWGQQAQQIFSTPTTVEVYSGTGLGVLFTQDVTTI